MFWKKKKVVEPRRFYIPEEHLLEVAKLADEFWRCPPRQDSEARVKLWLKVVEIVPEARDFQWQISTNVAKIYITEIL